MSDKINKTVKSILEELIDTGIIFLTKDDIVAGGKLSKEVKKYAYARERLREEQRAKLPEAEKAIQAVVLDKQIALLESILEAGDGKDWASQMAGSCGEVAKLHTTLQSQRKKLVEKS